MSLLGEGSLTGEVTTLAPCWKLTRGDGLVLGLTAHDRDLTMDGVRYRARPGMTPSAVSHAIDLTADSMEAEGPLSSAGFSGLDLDIGRWTDAKVEMFLCDWANAGSGRLALMRGTLGAISRMGLGDRDTFRAELLSELAALEAAEPLRLSPLCRAELGDGRCGVDMAGRRLELRALGWSGGRLQLASPPADPERYAWGRIRWISGPLTGLDRRVAGFDGDALLLEEPLPGTPEAAGNIWLWEGCDKRLATCTQRFENGFAFDGEPHVPGTDALLRYGDG